MSSVRMVHEKMGLNRSLFLCGVSKKTWYYTKRPRDIPPDPDVFGAVYQIATQRPTYGTRRMAAQVSRELRRPVNRKSVRRIFKRLGWNAPTRTKKEIIRSGKGRIPRPDGPGQFWESDMSYIWCGVDGWCYCFNVIDVFTRQWLSFVLADRATRHHAIMAVNNAVASSDSMPSLPGLILRVDNGSQYTSSDFRQSMSALGINLEYIYVNTPEQNGHIESFHKTLKKEYIWPREFADIQEARDTIQNAFEDYNHERIHSSLGYITPAEFAGLWQQRMTEMEETQREQIIGGEKCA